MLFITNRIPREPSRSQQNREVTFDPQNTHVSEEMLYCQRHDKEQYIELGQETFFDRLKQLPEQTQILFYIHGFKNIGEKDIFPKASKLQELLNEEGGDGLVNVVPIIWPCDNDPFFMFLDDYYDDQRAADKSNVSFSKMVSLLHQVRTTPQDSAGPWRNPIHILAHSMGNRVLMNGLKHAAANQFQGRPPKLFQNVFMLAADVEHHVLEAGNDGELISQSSKNVVVYYANDDFAMPAAKVANLKHRNLSRRLGRVGPKDISQTPENVFAVDCDDFNHDFDRRKGHTYHLTDRNENVSPVLKHMLRAITTGAVSPSQRSIVLKKDDW